MSIEFRRKKNIPTIFLGVGAKKSQITYSLLFKMSMISGKRKKTPPENNNIAPGTSGNQDSKTNFLSSCNEISVLCVHSLENMLFLYLSLFPIVERRSR